MPVKRLRSHVKRWVKHTFQSRPELTITTATADCATPSLAMNRKYRFTTVLEIFVDYTKDAQTSPGSPATISTYDRLGIIEEKDYDQDSSSSPASSSQWERLESHVAKLNRESDGHELYKVIYVVRHGRGVHNVVMDAVGPQWKEKWALQDDARLDELPDMPELPGTHGDKSERISWVDSPLVQKGREQARELARDWVKWNTENGMPIPGTIYTSPMDRCLETTMLIYGDVLRENGRNVQPVVKENLRERLTNHTCDRRHTRSWIEENYPKCHFESGFKDKDMLWKARISGTVNAETDDEHTLRKHCLLEDIFDTDNSHFISMTTHSYAISAILASVGSPIFRVKEGSMLAMLIKAEKEPPPMNGKHSGVGTAKQAP
ncbi:phosphoglycerate mutase [Apiospora kogelbergensis]|uniref:Phosphoglycerate mutase n=1 Tax=Apiospora kogelbergensis TaxID=1337665 RepID=A0AAW0Q6D2_9PEZI